MIRKKKWVKKRNATKNKCADNRPHSRTYRCLSAALDVRARMHQNSIIIIHPSILCLQTQHKTKNKNIAHTHFAIRHVIGQKWFRANMCAYPLSFSLAICSVCTLRSSRSNWILLFFRRTWRQPTYKYKQKQTSFIHSFASSPIVAGHCR